MTLAPAAAFASALCHSGCALIKRGVLRVQRVDALSYAFTYHAGGALLLLPALAFYSLAPSAPAGWFFAGLSALLWFGQAAIGFENIKQVEVPCLAVFKRSKLVFMALLAAVFLGEVISPQKAVALALVLAGSLVLTYESGRLDFGKRTLLVLLASFFSAAALVTDKTALNYFPLPAYAWLMYALPGTLLLVFAGKSPASHSLNLSGFRKWLALDVVLEVGGYLLLLYALKHGSAIVVALIVETALPLTALGGMVLLGEKRGWKKVLAATALALAGGVIALL